MEEREREKIASGVVQKSQLKATGSTVEREKSELSVRF